MGEGIRARIIAVKRRKQHSTKRANTWSDRPHVCPASTAASSSEQHLNISLISYKDICILSVLSCHLILRFRRGAMSPITKGLLLKPQDSCLFMEPCGQLVASFCWDLSRLQRTLEKAQRALAWLLLSAYTATRRFYFLKQPGFPADFVFEKGILFSSNKLHQFLLEGSKTGWCFCMCG